jgi:catalase
MNPTKPAKRAAKGAARKQPEVAEELRSGPYLGRLVPSQRPSRSRRNPHEPFEPKADQESPETRTPTGAETGDPKESNAQQGPYLTTAQECGSPIPTTPSRRASAVRRCSRTTTCARR